MYERITCEIYIEVIHVMAIIIYLMGPLMTNMLRQSYAGCLLCSLIPLKRFGVLKYS